MSMTELDGRRPAAGQPWQQVPQQVPQQPRQQVPQQVPQQPRQLWLFAREARRPGDEARPPVEVLAELELDPPLTSVSWLAEDVELDPVCTVEFACHTRRLHLRQRARRD